MNSRNKRRFAFAGGMRLWFEVMLALRTNEQGKIAQLWEVVEASGFGAKQGGIKKKTLRR
jgi:hypothetical protein